MQEWIRANEKVANAPKGSLKSWSETTFYGFY